MAFCPKCGRKGIKGRFCSECAETELDLGFKDIAVKRCVDCGKFQIRNSWKAFDDEDEGLAAASEAKIRNPGGVSLEIIPRHKELADKPGLKQELELEISAEGQDFVIPAWIEFTYCDKCSKSGTEYFEGTLQLRDATSDVIEFVRSDVASHEGVFIAKEKGRGGNVDMMISSAKYLRGLAKRLDSRFNGELKITAKLFTRNKQTSKEVHRVTVLFKLRSYKVGDVVESRGRKVRIKTLGKKVSGIDVETGKKVFVD